MGLTFSVIGAFALVLLAVGLLLTRNVRMGPVAVGDTPISSRSRGGEFFVVLSVVALVLAVGALLWVWALVALPH
jgi:hypothetical protein